MIRMVESEGESLGKVDRIALTHTFKRHHVRVSQTKQKEYEEHGFKILSIAVRAKANLL